MGGVSEYSRTTGIDTFTGEKLLDFGTGHPRMLVDLEAIDHILEINIFGIFDIEVARGEDVADRSVQRGKSVH